MNFDYSRLRTNLIYIVIATALIIGPASLRSSAAPGDLDPTFGQGGHVLTTIADPNYPFFLPQTESMLVQPDGKILVCGRFWEDGISTWYGTFIARYLPDGTLDTSFGTNGKVAVIEVLPGGYGSKAVGADMALQSDGKIVLIGSEVIAQKILVQRYTSDGVLDTTFGADGTVNVPRGYPPFLEGNSIVVQPDGKIVGTGWEYTFPATPYYDASLVFRLTADGAMDTSFGPSGTGIESFVNGYDGSKVLLQPDGKILTVGMRWNPSYGLLGDILLIRYNPNGSLDSTFGTGGSATYTINGANVDTRDAAILPDGKILVGGYFSPNPYHSFIARFNPDGSFDESFGSNGVVPISDDFGLEEILPDPSGKIVAVGNAFGGNNEYQFAIASFNANGSVDQQFGLGGRAVFPMNIGMNYARLSDGALQQDGKILAAGYFEDYYTDSHDTIALIRVGGASGASVSISGRVLTDFGQSIRNALVYIVDSTGTRRTVLTNSFGVYHFDDVAAGQSYQIGASARRYRFDSQTIQVSGNTSEIDFIGIN